MGRGIHQAKVKRIQALLTAGKKLSLADIEHVIDHFDLFDFESVKNCVYFSQLLIALHKDYKFEKMCEGEKNEQILKTPNKEFKDIIRMCIEQTEFTEEFVRHVKLYEAFYEKEYMCVIFVWYNIKRIYEKIKKLEITKPFTIYKIGSNYIIRFDCGSEKWFTYDHETAFTGSDEDMKEISEHLTKLYL